MLTNFDEAGFAESRGLPALSEHQKPNAFTKAFYVVAVALAMAFP